MSFLEGKKIVIMGVANKRSIAWGCAEAMMKKQWMQSANMLEKSTA